MVWSSGLTTTAMVSMLDGVLSGRGVMFSHCPAAGRLAHARTTTGPASTIAEPPTPLLPAEPPFPVVPAPPVIPPAPVAALPPPPVVMLLPDPPVVATTPVSPLVPVLEVPPAPPDAVWF